MGDSRIARHLRRAGLALDSVPAAGARVTLLDNANLSTGGSPPTDTDLCNTIVGSGFFQSPDVPNDGFVSTIFSATSGDGTGSTQARITAFETNEGNRTITIKGDAAVTAASFDAPVHTSDKAGTVVITGFVARTRASFPAVVPTVICRAGLPGIIGITVGLG